MKPVTVLVLAILLLITGCSHEPEPVPVYTVEKEVQPYVDQFVAEAKLRGKTITITNLIVQFGQINGAEACGQCQLQTNQTPRITLSTEANCWQNLSEQERECLVFHELGHCVLKRDHRIDRLADSTYASLMNKDNVSVYAVCRYPISETIPCDLRPRRTYYLDELFDPTTPVPAWAK